MMKTPKVAPTGAGRVAFLARLDEFRGLIQAGWPVTVVYENHGGDNTGLSYSQFARYVGKYIRKPTKRGAQQPTIPDEMPLPITPQVGQKQAGASTVPTPMPKRQPGFQHDPSSGNNRDDLI
ncbi:TraK family protein [Pseudomonas syringae pv. actinidiae]|nr:TraK family protein [Pseudomonas syringae pv. actinidiae]